MFQERIKELFDTLEVSNQEIAECAGCTPSTISRLKSGARKPNPKSPTIDKLTNGVVQYATISNKLQTLLDLIGITDSQLLDTGIRHWLYSDDKSLTGIGDVNSDQHSHATSPSFSEKFNTIMVLSDMSNIKLSKIVNVDTSYISRFRNGIRSPKSNPELFDGICVALFEQLDSKDLLPELITTINAPKKSFYNNNNNIRKDELYLYFHAWMDDFDTSDHQAIRHLLGAIDTFTPNINIKIPPLSAIVPNAVIDDTSTYYIGIDGLRQSVLRFLGSVVKYHYKELLLYSDQSMEWMTYDDNFRMQWAALMAMCIKQGTHITIIHNIDRDIVEMIEAVESWLPLYVSGKVDSYYSHKAVGNRFNRTLFLIPGKAAIAATHANGMDDKVLYNYYTDSAHLDFLHEDFKCMVSESGPLATIQQSETTDDRDDIISKDNFNSLSLSLTQNKVIVAKNSLPKLSITFTHPLLCNAFQAYIDKSRLEF